jgi:hypothetical protein
MKVKKLIKQHNPRILNTWNTFWDLILFGIFMIIIMNIFIENKFPIVINKPYMMFIKFLNESNIPTLQEKIRNERINKINDNLDGNIGFDVVYPNHKQAL